MKNKVILLFLTMIWYGQIYAQNNSISGTVRDASDTPLPGVSIIISGTSQGTVTDIDGKYSLSAPPNATLIFSYIGHQAQTIEVQNRSQIDVMLNSSDIGLEEVVVTALGIKEKPKPSVSPPPR